MPLQTIYSQLTFLAVSVVLFSSCGDTSTTQTAMDTDSSFAVLEAAAVPVETFILHRQPFNKELLANGKLSAPHRADLRFGTQGLIKSIHVREGQSVRTGQLIAELDDTDQKIAIQQNELDHYKAVLDYEDQLLRLGYRLSDTANLPQDIKSVARLRSGLTGAEIGLRRAQQQLSQTKLLAPINGKIANLKARAFNNTSSFDYICTLIDDHELYVEFKVLEQEIPFVRASQSVTVTAFSAPHQRYIGKISSINPLIDEAGMITVKASIRQDGQLLDGMAVKVSIKQTLPDQLSIPKEAVLDRQGRKVVFTRVDSLAQWNYVDLLHENSSHYVIGSGLEVGNEVIYKGNFNLAHDRKVTVTRSN